MAGGRGRWSGVEELATGPASERAAALLLERRRRLALGRGGAARSARCLCVATAHRGAPVRNRRRELGPLTRPSDPGRRSRLWSRPVERGALFVSTIVAVVCRASASPTDGQLPRRRSPRTLVVAPTAGRSCGGARRSRRRRAGRRDAAARLASGPPRAGGLRRSGAGERGAVGDRGAALLDAACGGVSTRKSRAARGWRRAVKRGGADAADALKAATHRGLGDRAALAAATATGGGFFMVLLDPAMRGRARERHAGIARGRGAVPGGGIAGSGGGRLQGGVAARRTRPPAEPRRASPPPLPCNDPPLGGARLFVRDGRRRRADFSGRRRSCGGAARGHDRSSSRQRRQTAERCAQDARAAGSGKGGLGREARRSNDGPQHKLAIAGQRVARSSRCWFSVVGRASSAARRRCWRWYR